MNWLRGPWLLVGGLVLGLALGLFYARVISPVSYEDTTPLALNPTARDAYRMMIADAFSADGDLGRARARLALFSDEDPVRALAAQAQALVARGGRTEDARSLALLAASLRSPTGISSPAPAAIPSPAAPAASAGTPTVAATAASVNALAVTPFPTVTLTATPHAPFVLKNATPVCDPSLGAPLLQVIVRDHYQFGVPGVQAQVTWDGGQDSFYTGLKPQQGPGYGDFTMTPGVVYTLRLGDGGAPVENLTAAVCPAPTGVSPAKAYAGGVLLEFGVP